MRSTPATVVGCQCSLSIFARSCIFFHLLQATGACRANQRTHVSRRENMANVNLRPTHGMKTKKCVPRFSRCWCWLFSLARTGATRELQQRSQACSAVKIINLKVPSTYLLDQTSKTPDPLILDCEYEVDENEKGFVLKWLLDGQPVYQWIPSKNPFPFQSFKNRVDTSYVVSQEHLHKHRAMAIIKPLANFTGEYSCIVQTYASIDRRAAKLKIIVRESKFDLSYYSNGDGEVTVDCQARDISPLPELQIRINNELFATENFKSVQGENGLYNASISGTLRKDQLESPAQIECLLTIPETNYIKRRSTTYYELYATESNSARSLRKLTSCSIFVTMCLVSSRIFSR